MGSIILKWWNFHSMFTGLWGASCCQDSCRFLTHCWEQAVHHTDPLNYSWFPWARTLGIRFFLTVFRFLSKVVKWLLCTSLCFSVCSPGWPWTQVPPTSPPPQSWDYNCVPPYWMSLLLFDCSFCSSITLSFICLLFPLSSLPWLSWSSMNFLYEC